MQAALHEWANLIVRWIHVIAAIMWIGDSFLFMWLDSHLSPPETPREGAVVGELWMVHSGGFYEVVKRKSLAALPRQLYWFKWESYTTWITGFFLLGIVYYGSGGVYLLDSASGLSPMAAVAVSLGLLASAWLVYDALWMSPLQRNPRALGAFCYAAVVAIAWGLTRIFSGRAVFIHVGAMLGTIMAANVRFRIIPAQKYMLAQTAADQPVDTTLGLRAKQRSIQNHYMTLPVLFTMLSNHFPATYGHPRSWLVLALLIIVGAGLKYFMNFRLKTSPLVAVPTLAALCGVIVMTSLPEDVVASMPELANASPVPFSTVRGIVDARCVTCHATHPSNPSFSQPPNGVVFDNPKSLHDLADRILVRAVVTKTMPLGNLTGMTPEERTTLGAWIIQGAKTDSLANESPWAAAARDVFQTRCVLCHGASGHGDGAAAASLNPKPRDYTNHAWQASVTDDAVRKIILTGGAQVGKSPLMPANPDLADKPQLVDELVHIVRSFDRQ